MNFYRMVNNVAVSLILYLAFGLMLIIYGLLWLDMRHLCME
jgi:hypothetical protein